MSDARSLIPFKTGDIVEEICVEVAGMNTDEEQRQVQLVKVVWHDREMCQTATGYVYSRNSGAEYPADPEVYRGIHTPGYRQLLLEE